MADTSDIFGPLIRALRVIREGQILSQIKKAAILTALSEQELSLIPVLLTAQLRNSWTRCSKVAKARKRLIVNNRRFATLNHTSLGTVTPCGFDQIIKSGTVFSYIANQGDRQYAWDAMFDPRRLYVGDPLIEKLPGGFRWLMPQYIPGADYYGVMRPIDLPDDVLNPLAPDFDKWSVEEKADGRNMLMYIYKRGYIVWTSRGGKTYCGSKSILKDRMIFSPVDVPPPPPGGAPVRERSSRALSPPGDPPCAGSACVPSRRQATQSLRGHAGEARAPGVRVHRARTRGSASKARAPARIGGTQAKPARGANKLLYVLNVELVAGDATGARPAEESANAGIKKAGIAVVYDVVYSYTEVRPIYTRSLRTRQKVVDEIVTKYTGVDYVFDPVRSFASTKFLWRVRRFTTPEEIQDAVASNIEGLVYKRYGHPYYGVIPEGSDDADVDARKNTWYRWKKATTIDVQIESGKFSDLPDLLTTPMSLAMLVDHQGTLRSVGYVASLSEADRSYITSIGYNDLGDGTFQLDDPIYAEITIDPTKTVRAGTVPFRHPRIHRFRDKSEGFTLTTHSSLFD
jgi:hypothetical protein